MNAAVENENSTPKPSAVKPLMIGVTLAIVGAMGGYYVIQSGLFEAAKSGADPDHQVEENTDGKHEGGSHASSQKLLFIPITPLLISLPKSGGRAHLRFSAQVEVAPEGADRVEEVQPRIADVLNTYLRAVEISDLENPSSLNLLRAQMLRRINLVVGNNLVRDLLIMEFVIN